MLATSSAARSLLARTIRRNAGAAATLGAARTMASIEPYADYGKGVFTGRVADEYLKKHGSSGDILKDPSWTATHKDTVAAAVLDWAIDRGANTYCHWFQPMASSGVRHGQTGQVQNMMMKFNRSTNDVEFDFDGDMLIKGETDGSSYPNGGLRATHTAGGYLALDTSSPIFLRGDTVFIPSALVSYYGAALDEKTPLLRSNAALSKHGKRLLKHLGLDVGDRDVVSNIGLEQEFFLVPGTSTTGGPTCRWRGGPSSGGTRRAARRCATTTWRPPASPTRRWRACRRCRTSAGGSGSRSRPATGRWPPGSTSSRRCTGSTPRRWTRT